MKYAGLVASHMSEPYDDLLLIQKLVELTQELGHFPVSAEMRMKRRRDASFPSDKVFERIGNRKQIRAKLAEFCRIQGGLDDIIRHFDLGASTTLDHVELSDSPSEENGYVYLLRSGRYHKIGRSNLPRAAASTS